MSVALIGGLALPSFLHAQLNASAVLGQTSNSTGTTQTFTKSGPNDGPNDRGFNMDFSPVASTNPAIDTVNHRLFVSDPGNNRVLVFNLDTSNNLVDRIADNVLGQPDLFTNTAATTQSGLSGPTGLAFDSGTPKRLFVADTSNNRVLVFDVDSVTDGENAINVLGQTGFTTSTPNQTSGVSGCNTAVNPCGLDNPTGLAFDSGTPKRLFVADTNNNRVLVFDVTAITDGESAVNVLGQANFKGKSAGTDQDRMRSPTGLAFDSGTPKRLFVADSANHRVLVFDVTAITDGESAINVLGQAAFNTSTAATTQAGMSDPTGLVFDTNRLFVTEEGNNRVMIFDVTTITDGENATDALGQLALDGTTALFTKSGQNNAPKERGFNLSGVFNETALDTTNHRLFVADPANNRVLVHTLDTNNNLIDQVADSVLGQVDFLSRATTTDQSTLSSPRGLAYDGARSFLFVADTSHNRILVFDVTTITNGELAVEVLGQTAFNSSTANIQNASQGCNTTPNACGLNSPIGLAFDATGKRLFVADSSNHRVLVLDVSSIIDGEAATHVLGQANFTTNTAATTQAGMSSPAGLAFDSAGNRLFVADDANNRVLVFTTITTGQAAANVLGQADFITNTAATIQAGISGPQGVALDAENNRLFVAQIGNDRITTYDVTTITNGEPAEALLGQSSFTTSGAATAQNRFNDPRGLFFFSTNAFNHLVVNDTGNHRVLFYDLISITTTSLPATAERTAYSQTLVTSGGIGTLTFSLASGSLPPGLSLSSAGVISGASTTTGIFSFTVRVQDSATPAGFTDVQTFSLLMFQIPTLSEWGRILLALLLAALALRALRRQGRRGVRG